MKDAGRKAWRARLTKVYARRRAQGTMPTPEELDQRAAEARRKPKRDATRVKRPRIRLVRGGLPTLGKRR